MQNTSRILMIRPMHFMFNAETAINNSFQSKGNQENLSAAAVGEFDELVGKLRLSEIDVTVIEDSPHPHTPDAIFPNNWISFHENGIYCLYPMFAPNRRMERKTEVLEIIKNKFHYEKLIDFTGYEMQNLFLEGTGSMVLDREKRIAYACLSPRTHEKVFLEFCRIMNYMPVSFHATNDLGQSIYHTNVMMCVADQFVVICLESIADHAERKIVRNHIINSEKEIVEISMNQLNQFAGNMLQLENFGKEKILVMSSAAWSSLNPGQLDRLNNFNAILHSSLERIESNGGGSARCMIAELHG